MSLTLGSIELHLLHIPSLSVMLGWSEFKHQIKFKQTQKKLWEFNMQKTKAVKLGLKALLRLGL